MGLDYHLSCSDCCEDSIPTEFSIVGYVSMKHPDEAEDIVCDWTKFMVRHGGHKVILMDAFGRRTDPAKTKGAYVLGIESIPTLEEKS